MTVKELINVLKGIEKKYGNKEVFIHDPFYDSSSSKSVTSLGIWDAKEINVFDGYSNGRPGIKVDIFG